MARPLQTGRGVIIMLIALTLTTGTVVSGCSSKKEAPSPAPSASPSNIVSGWRAQARELLAAHGLKPSGQFRQVAQGRLREGQMGFELFSSASRTIGLDLASHAGERAQWFTVALQAADVAAPVSATFVVQDAEIIGAAAITGADPGVESFADVGQ